MFNQKSLMDWFRDVAQWPRPATSFGYQKRINDPDTGASRLFRVVITPTYASIDESLPVPGVKNSLGGQKYAWSRVTRAFYHEMQMVGRDLKIGTLVIKAADHETK